MRLFEELGGSFEAWETFGDPAMQSDRLTELNHRAQELCADVDRTKRTFDSKRCIREEKK